MHDDLSALMRELLVGEGGLPKEHTFPGLPVLIPPVQDAAGPYHGTLTTDDPRRVQRPLR